MIQLDTSQADVDVNFQVTYHDSLYHGGIPLVGEAYEFTVIIDYVSYEGKEAVFISASHGSIDEDINIKDIETPLPEPFFEHEVPDPPVDPPDEPFDAE